MMKNTRNIRLGAIAAAALVLTSCGITGGDPLAQGREAFENNAYGDARIHLKNALQNDPQSPEANLLFAKTMLALGDGLTAQNALDKLTESDLLTAQEARNLRADALLLQGKSEAARTLLQKDVGSWNALSFALAARAALELGELGQAQSLIESGLKAHAKDAELLAIDAAILLEQGRLTPAKKSAAAALANDGNNLDALLINGQLAQLTGNDKAARKFFDTALEKHPDSRIPLLSLAAIRADLGEYDEALNLLDRADSLFTVQALSAYLRARIYFEQGDAQSAYNLMQEAEKALSDHPPSLLLAGEIAAKRKNYNQAEEKLVRFLGFSPGHGKGTLLLADALDQQGDAKGAAQLLDSISGRADIDPGVLNYAAGIYNKAGQPAKAALMKRRADAPNNEKLGEQAVSAGRLLSQGKTAQALALYEKAIAGGLGNNALVRNNAAYAALELKQYDKALSNARAAFALTPDDPSVRDTMGWVLLKTGGNKAEALEHLQFASRLRPADIEIRWHLAQAYIANGRQAEARTHIEFMIPFVPGEQRKELEKIAAAL